MSTVFALNESNHLVHVSEVTRGLACKCRCVQCVEPVLARRGPVRGHHFAHASHREPCDSNHESLLHWYAKQLIIEARVLVVPMTAAIEQFMGLPPSTSGAHMLHALGAVQEEVSLGAVRPDILVTSADGVQIAVEVAYSSFCDLVKAAAFEAKGLPAIEIDLSGFPPDHFDPEALRRAVIESVTTKRWVWPTEPEEFTELGVLPDPPKTTPTKTYLPEETISFSGRWVSVRQFPSGDIAVKVVAWDPDLVSLVRTVAKSHGGRFNPAYKTWNVPRWAANTVRTQLKEKAAHYRISMSS
jgi:competence protein CoiA